MPTNNDPSTAPPAPVTYFIPSEPQILGLLQEKLNAIQRPENSAAYHRLLNRFRINSEIDLAADNNNEFNPRHKLDKNDLNFSACIDTYGLLDKDKFSYIVIETLKALGITEPPSLLAQIQVLPFARYLAANFALEALRREFLNQNKDLASFLDESSAYFRTYELIKQAFDYSARPKYYHEDLSNQRQFIYALYLYNGGHSIKRKTDDERLQEVQNAYNEFKELDEKGYAPGTYWVATLQNHYGIYTENERILTSDNKHFKNAIQNNYSPSQLILLEEYINFVKNNDEIPLIYQSHETHLLDWLKKYYQEGDSVILSLLSDIKTYHSVNARFISKIIADINPQTIDLQKKMSVFSRQMKVKALYHRFNTLHMINRELIKILHDAPSDVLLQLNNIERIFLPNKGIQYLFDITNKATEPSQEEIELLEGVCKETSDLLKKAIRGQEAVPPKYLTALEEATLYSSDSELEIDTNYQGAVQPLKSETPAHYEILSRESTDLGRALFGPFGGIQGAIWGSIAGTAISPGVGTIVGGILGAITGALTTAWIGSKLVPPVTRWITKRIEYYQQGNALGVKRAALVASMVGIVLGGLLGALFVHFTIAGLSALLGACVGVFVLGGISFGIAYIAEKYFGATHNAMHISAYGTYIGAVLGGIVGTIFIPIPGLGTFIGAAIGSAVGTIFTAATMWLYNSFRSPEAQEQDHRILVTVVTAITGGSTTCSMSYNFLKPLLSHLPYIGEIGAGAISIIAGFAGGGVWAYISRQLFHAAEHETPINQDNSSATVEAPLDAVGMGSSLANAAAAGLRHTYGNGATIHSPLTNTDIAVDATAGLVVTEVATTTAPLSGGIFGYLHHMLTSPFTSSTPAKNREEEKVVALGQIRTDYSGESQTWVAAVATSTPEADSTKPLLRKRFWHSPMSFHRTPEQWLYRPDAEANKVSRFSLPSDDFIRKLPHYDSHQRHLDNNGSIYVVIHFNNGTTLQVRSNEIALIGKMPPNQAILQDVCQNLMNELNWKDTTSNPQHTTLVSHHSASDKAFPVSFDKKNN